MANKLKSTGAQNVMLAEFNFNFDDTMENIAGAAADFKAVGTPAFDIISLPPNSIVTGGQILVTSAYVGPTVATISLGDSGSATRYASTVNLLAAARTALTIPNVVNTGGLAVRATFNITVAPASAGVVKVQIEYVIVDRANELNR